MIGSRAAMLIYWTDKLVWFVETKMPCLRHLKFQKFTMSFSHFVLLPYGKLWEQHGKTTGAAAVFSLYIVSLMMKEARWNRKSFISAGVPNSNSHKTDVLECMVNKAFTKRKPCVALPIGRVKFSLSERTTVWVNLEWYYFWNYCRKRSLKNCSDVNNIPWNRVLLHFNTIWTNYMLVM